MVVKIRSILGSLNLDASPASWRLEIGDRAPTTRIVELGMPDKDQGDLDSR